METAGATSEAGFHWEEVTMHFCITGQYTPQALGKMMDNPTTNRFEAARKVVEAEWENDCNV
jgi:hypothetical protein